MIAETVMWHELSMNCYSFDYHIKRMAHAFYRDENAATALGKSVGEWNCCISWLIWDLGWYLKLTSLMFDIKGKTITKVILFSKVMLFFGCWNFIRFIWTISIKYKCLSILFYELFLVGNDTYRRHGDIRLLFPHCKKFFFLIGFG